MYLVLTTQSAADVTVPGVAPRCVTRDPKHALKVARMAQSDPHSCLVSTISIFHLSEDEVYDISYLIGDLRGNRGVMLVFTSTERTDSNGWIERFLGDHFRNAVASMLPATLSVYEEMSR